MALRDVFVDELRDLYSAENQLAKASPRLTRATHDAELKKLLKDHAEQTKEQIQRLRKAFEILGKKPTGKHCEGMEGVIKEVLEALEEERTGASFDAGLLGAALRIEHYEIAGYEAVILMAKALHIRDVADLLKESLAEEEKMARRLHSTAKNLFKQAAKEEEMQGDLEPESKKSGEEKESERKSKDDEQEAGVESRKRSKDKRGKKAKRVEESAAKEPEAASL